MPCLWLLSLLVALFCFCSLPQRCLCLALAWSASLHLQCCRFSAYLRHFSTCLRHQFEWIPSQRHAKTQHINESQKVLILFCNAIHSLYLLCSFSYRLVNLTSGCAARGSVHSSGMACYSRWLHGVLELPELFGCRRRQTRPCSAADLSTSTTNVPIASTGSLKLTPITVVFCMLGFGKWCLHVYSTSSFTNAIENPATQLAIPESKAYPRLRHQWCLLLPVEAILSQ